MSFAAAGILAVAVLVCGLAAALVAYAAVHARPFGSDALYQPALQINAGLTVDATTIADVVPGGPAWTIGLRPGWILDPSGAADLEGAVGACSPELHCTLYHELQIEHALAGRWVFEVVAVSMVVAGLAMWRRRPRLAGVLALGGVAISAPTYALLGQVPLFPALYAVSLAAPPIWLRLTGTRAVWSVVLAVCLLLSASWVAAWAAVPVVYDLVERTRVLAVIAVVVAGIAVASGRIARVDPPTERERAVDVIAAGAALIWAVTTLSFRVIPEWIAAAVTVLGVVAYFAFRNRVAGLLARLNLAEIRQRATLQALEAERWRVARDLHDVPLQELAAVIHRLDKRSGTSSEVQQLRQIAGHLRNVTTSLRPPLLDDVGLGAALADLAEQRADDEAQIRITLDDATGIERDSRPSTDVELAVFRIAQEAVTNARRHGHSSLIEVQGRIARDNVRVEVRDNGRGFDQDAARRAASAGRLGLASMRERAAAIGATLTVSSSPEGMGTSVVVAWEDR